MEGFLKPFVPELKIKDYQTYHAFRRGIREHLWKEYGFFACRVMASDMLLFALLCDSLAGREGTRQRKRYPNSLLRAREVLSYTQGVRLATKMQVILAWDKLRDQIEYADNAFVKTRCQWRQFCLHSAYQKALQGEGEVISRLIAQERDHAIAVGLAQSHDYEVASEPFANLFAMLFLHCAADDTSWKPLRAFGFQLGRICYFISSVQRYSFDKKAGKYNIFIQNGLTYEMAVESAQRQCNVAAVELAKASALLNIQLNRTLIDNVIYLGLEHAVQEIGKNPLTVETTEFKF